ncbi:hypothetical protein TNCV_4654521 [Trichonephila clavipes]|nr:hypothetical protein TNCV_4654521 [Trichonephila clavipes]
MERKTQQGGTSSIQKGSGRNDSPTSKSEQDQAGTRMPDEEVDQQRLGARKGKGGVYEKVHILGGPAGRIRQLQVIRTRRIAYRFYILLKKWSE